MDSHARPVSLRERPVGPLHSLRARGDAAQRVAAVLGVGQLPAPNRTAESSSARIVWLRPDEWLIEWTPEDRGLTARDLATALGDDGAVVDVSASRVCLEVRGDAARWVLAGPCPLDLHPRAFPPGACAQTLVAKAPVLLTLHDPSPTFHVYVRPSLAAYVRSWLEDSAAGTDGDAILP